MRNNDLNLLLLLMALLPGIWIVAGVYYPAYLLEIVVISSALALLLTLWWFRSQGISWLILALLVAAGLFVSALLVALVLPF